MAELKELKEIEELEAALAASTERPVLFFKHSNQCPISARALREFHGFLETADAGVDYHLIVVQTARPVSNEVEARLGITHESPQAIFVRDGKPVWNASHFDITAETLKGAVGA